MELSERNLSETVIMFNSVAYADSLDEVIFRINDKILNPAIEIAFVVALVVFLFGVMEFIRGANKEEKRTKGKQHMLWGIIGFLIMFGVFSIINILTRTFGISGVKMDNGEQKFDPPPIQELKIPK